MSESFLIIIFLPLHPEMGKICQVAGWGKIQKPPNSLNLGQLLHTPKNELNNTKILNPNEVTEFCVRIGSIKQCRNNHLVHNLNQSGVTSISDIKPKVHEITGLVHKG